MLIDRKMKKMELCEFVGIAPATMWKLGKDEYVALSVLDRICQKFNCTLNDIVEIIPDPPAEPETPTEE
jgi:DNA-binding Xre family transcriptional regulator